MTVGYEPKESLPHAGDEWRDCVSLDRKQRQALRGANGLTKKANRANGCQDLDRPAAALAESWSHSSPVIARRPLPLPHLQPAGKIFKTLSRALIGRPLLRISRPLRYTRAFSSKMAHNHASHNPSMYCPRNLSLCSIG